METKVLLIDDSVTVQKVVALTLDKSAFDLNYAKSRNEVIRVIKERCPDVVLLSDHLTDIQASSFPKELEAILGPTFALPSFILITTGEPKPMRHYAGVLKKPFVPAELQKIVKEVSQRHRGVEDFGNDRGLKHLGEMSPPPKQDNDRELEQVFNHAFADEGKLVEETFRGGSAPLPEGEDAWGRAVPATSKQHLVSVEELWHEKPSSFSPSKPQNASQDLWTSGRVVELESDADLLGSDESMAYKATLENKVEEKLLGQDLERIVGQVLERVIPPIVERLVKQRLEELLASEERAVDGKL